jgi:hypothetical protein
MSAHASSGWFFYPQLACLASWTTGELVVSLCADLLDVALQSSVGRLRINPFSLAGNNALVHPFHFRSTLQTFAVMAVTLVVLLSKLLGWTKLTFVFIEGAERKESYKFQLNCNCRPAEPGRILTTASGGTRNMLR